jgi:hypothetical protein
VRFTGNSHELKMTDEVQALAEDGDNLVQEDGGLILLE